MKIFAICTLIGTVIFACLGIWQIAMLHEVCAPVLHASATSDLVIPEGSVFGMAKELTLSFGFANLSLDGAIVCSVLALFVVILSWKTRNVSSVQDA
jgi:hypothetical protein